MTSHENNWQSLPFLREFTLQIQATQSGHLHIEKYHIPPTKPYMDLLIQGAYSAGLSMMWIAYLQSFSIQEGRAPRPPKV